FVEYYKRLLFFFIENPAVKLSDVEIVSEEEKTQLLFDFNAAQSDYPKEKTLQQLFEEQVERTPDNISVIFKEHHYSYKMLNRRSNQLARQLRQKGASAGMMTGIMVKRSPEMLTGIMAILKTGGAYLPIDPDYPQERKAYILEDSNVELLLFMKECESSLGEISRLIDLEDKTLYQGAGENPGIMNKAGDPVYVIYTSGSTGKPKGVMVEQRNIVNYICWAIKIHKKNGSLNFPLFTSFSFDLTVTSIFTPLLSGSTVVVYEEREQVYVIGEVFDDNRLDIVKLTPSHLKLIQVPRSITIKHLILGGENLESQLALKTLEKFSSDVVIYNEYGPTETAVGCMIYRFSPGTDTRQFVPIGIPAGNVQVYVLDKNKRPLPPGVPGEIYISGDGVSRGYLNQPRLTAGRFIDNPFLAGKRMYKTGDMAKFLPGNQIEFLGRIDHQVKVRGFRVELEEIQDGLMGYKKNTPIAFLDRDAHEIDLNENHLCRRCLLPDNYPEIHLDDEGVCNTCREFERYKDEVNNYFKTGEDFEQLIAGTQKDRQGKYDCLLLFSGGKDSTYVLYQLIDMGLRVLTFTFDNGYISDAAFANIQRTTSELNVENIVGTAENMNSVFVESLNTHHDVCHGCWNAVNTYGIKVAHE
ncbi:MAG: amino acid adenylation domain-containing protein, partial [bacterium]|nr:amino acid adenylation domain-containing protein [bacterium]